MSHLWPQFPAVMLLNFFSFFQPYPKFEGYPKGTGPFFDNAEYQFNEFSFYYHIPTLSLKAAVYDLFLQGNVHHFKVFDKK